MISKSDRKTEAQRLEETKAQAKAHGQRDRKAGKKMYDCPYRGLVGLAWLNGWREG